MTDCRELLDHLKEHQVVAQDLFSLVEREGQALRQGSETTLQPCFADKQALLGRLKDSVAKLKKLRTEWTVLSPEHRAEHPEINALLRQTQDLTMKIIMLDRENEQSLLRRGLVPPRDIPSANRQRPHFVADLYRRQGQH
jgi:flagellar biosynthesis/type III secretory pathway chaperone